MRVFLQTEWRSMKKIRSLFVGTLLVGLYTMVGSTAFALLSPQAGLSQFTFQTAHLDILVGTSSGGPFLQELSLNTNDLLLPNNTEHTVDFWIKNASSNGFQFALSGELGEGNQDWEVLKKVIEVKVSNLSIDTGWHTLENWSLAKQSFPGVLGSGATQRYQLVYRLPDRYPTDPDGDGPLQTGDQIGEELEGKITAGMTFTISGEIQ